MKRVSVVVFDVFLLLTVGESRRSIPAGGRLDGAARDGASQLLALVPPRLAVEGKLALELLPPRLAVEGKLALTLLPPRLAIEGKLALSLLSSYLADNCKIAH